MSVFMKGQKCELRVLEPKPEEVRAWTDGVMSGLTTKHLFTGSLPMRYIDVEHQWEKEREAGDILFAIYAIGDSHPDAGYSVKFVGTCGLHSHREIYRSWELRILIFDPAAVGKGIGSEAVRLLTDYAFTRLNAHRVWLGVNEENKVAYECYRKAGFNVEGILRDEIFCWGRYVNAIRMAVLEREWKGPLAHA